MAADEEGNVFDIPEYAAPGRSGSCFTLPAEEEWIALPPGSDLFHLPGRIPLGIDRQSGELVLIPQYQGISLMAVSAFLAPAYTLYHHPAYQTQLDAPRLPLYAFSAIGWHKDQFVAPAVRVDADTRQDHDQYTPKQVEKSAARMLKRYPDNRLARHLIENCLLTYRCPAARNFALERWEMPLPTAPACNSRCFGCISKQPEDGFPPSQNRLDFVPTPEEIAQIAVPHLQTADRPVASFGQGCEGEPLTHPRLLEEAIRLIRHSTSRGTLNLNTNASKPDAVARLFDTGLDSIRVSVNSLLPDWYCKYYVPQGYCFEDVLESIRIACRKGKFISINYLVFPGITDTPQESDALFHFLQENPINMIQWRNLNLDPEEYLALLAPDPSLEPLGMANIMQQVRESFPTIRFGYFNPCLD